jgi:hypothetical protein
MKTISPLLLTTTITVALFVFLPEAHPAAVTNFHINQCFSTSSTRMHTKNSRFIFQHTKLCVITNVCAHKLSLYVGYISYHIIFHASLCFNLLFRNMPLD